MLSHLDAELDIRTIFCVEAYKSFSFWKSQRYGAGVRFKIPSDRLGCETNKTLVLDFTLRFDLKVNSQGLIFVHLLASKLDFELQSRLEIWD